MNKKVIIYIITLVVLCVSVFLLVNLLRHRNEKLEITMKSNGGVPYKWIYEIEDESIVKCVKNYVVDSNKDIDGGYISTNYVFKGLKKGKSKVTFKYISISDNKKIDKKEEFILKVDSNKNVSLVGLDN